MSGCSSPRHAGRRLPNRRSSRRGGHLTAEESERRIGLYREGKSDTQIAKLLGLDRSTISDWRSKAGFPPHVTPNKLNTVASDQRRALYDRGYSDRQIAETLGVSVTTICRWRLARHLPVTGGTPPATRSANPIDGDTDKACLTLYHSGWFDAQIARAFRFDVKKVRQWRERRALPALRSLVSPNYEKVEQLFRAGLADDAIAEACGCSDTTICAWRKRNGLQPNFPNPVVTPEQKARARRLLLAGMTHPTFSKRCRSE